jgi:integrase
MEIQKQHIFALRVAVWWYVRTCEAAPDVWCRQDQKTGNSARMLVYDARVKDAGKYGLSAGTRSATTYRSWLDETGTPMKVQQELMRHASIQTTMDAYGQAMSNSKREANSKVVEMVLKPLRASA